MTYRVALTELANSDLRGIYEYIAFSLLEPENVAEQRASPDASGSFYRVLYSG